MTFCDKEVVVYFDRQGRYVRVKSSSSLRFGLVFGIQWPGGGAVIKEGEMGHPIWDIPAGKIPLLDRKTVKFVQLPRASKLCKDGTPQAYAPKRLNDSLTVLLHGRPLTTMGCALALATAGAKARSTHAKFLVRAFQTTDHPFRGIENSHLEEAIRLAYSGVSKRC